MTDKQMALDAAGVIALILKRHPQGVTPRELIGGLVGPECKYSQAQQHYRDALNDGMVRVGWAGRLYAPKEDQYDPE